MGENARKAKIWPAFLAHLAVQGGNLRWFSQCDGSPLARRYAMFSYCHLQVEKKGDVIVVKDIISRATLPEFLVQG